MIRPDTKLNFEEALERINDERYVAAAHVRADALRRKVWVAEWHMPGCLSESRIYGTSKADAINAACGMAEGENGIPRGMRTALQRHGRFDSDSPIYGPCVNTVSRCTLADIL